MCFFCSLYGFVELLWRHSFSEDGEEEEEEEKKTKKKHCGVVYMGYGSSREMSYFQFWT